LAKVEGPKKITLVNASRIAAKKFKLWNAFLPLAANYVLVRGEKLHVEARRLRAGQRRVKASGRGRDKLMDYAFGRLRRGKTGV